MNIGQNVHVPDGAGLARKRRHRLAGIGILGLSTVALAAAFSKPPPERFEFLRSQVPIQGKEWGRYRSGPLVPVDYVIPKDPVFLAKSIGEELNRRGVRPERADPRYPLERRWMWDNHLVTLVPGVPRLMEKGRWPRVEMVRKQGVSTVTVHLLYEPDFWEEVKLAVSGAENCTGIPSDMRTHAPPDSAER